MNRRLRTIAFSAGLTLMAAGGLASTAAASFHENLIREVHEASGPSGDYVELQAYSAGQNLVSGKHIVSYDAGGAVLTNFTFPSNVDNVANQATILVANAGLVNGVTPDFDTGDLNVDNTGGTVCYTDSSITVALDCVAFDGTGGTDVTVPTFNPSQFGAPFALPGAN